MRLILVPVANRPECGVALHTAFGLAAALGADVAGYHIGPQHREQEVALGPLLPDDEVHAAFAVTDRTARARSKAARELFRRAAAKHAFAAVERPARGTRRQALWHEVSGTPARVFAVVGPVADLAIVSRPTTGAPSRARAFLLAALLHSAKPVLVLPQTTRPTLGQTVVIAWNQSADAAAAVTAALPLLAGAKRVVVVGAGRQDRLGPQDTDVVRYLAHWDIKAERQRTPGHDVERELEWACLEVGADLLVMGAYSRNRFRQLVFGGVTEHMLFTTDLPVLMLHR